MLGVIAWMARGGILDLDAGRAGNGNGAFEERSDMKVSSRVYAAFAVAVLLPAALVGVSGCAVGGGAGGVSAGLGELVSCSHSASGDMNGNYYHAELRAADDGGLVLTVGESPDHMTPITVREYRADDDALDQLRAIIDKYDMVVWDDLPMGEFFPLDAAGNSISMEFASSEPDGYPESYSVDRYSDLPDEGFEAYDAFMKCLFQWKIEDRLIREYIQE